MNNPLRVDLEVKSHDEQQPDESVTSQPDGVCNMLTP